MLNRVKYDLIPVTWRHFEDEGEWIVFFFLDGDFRGKVTRINSDTTSENNQQTFIANETRWELGCKLFRNDVSVVFYKLKKSEE